MTITIISALVAFIIGAILTLLGYNHYQQSQALKHANHETYYSNLIAKRIGGQTEFLLYDGTRVDVLTDTHAIEVEWCQGGKIYEAVGQALYYSLVTGKAPGIYLLRDKQVNSQPYFDRCEKICKRHGIALWTEIV